MNFQKKNLILYSIVLISLGISVFLWDKIFLPFKDPKIVGVYTQQEYHSLNDPIRYLVFISLPLLTWLIGYIYFYNNKFDKFFYNFKNSEIFLSKKNNFTNFTFLLIIFFLILEFLSLNFPINKIDLVHDGQQLSSAYRNYLDNSLWSNSYVIVGIFHETLNASFVWKIFNEISIGYFRYSILIYLLVFKILLLILIYKISSVLKFNDSLKSIYLFLSSIIILSLTDYTVYSSDQISYREIPVLLGLILIANIFTKSKYLDISIIILSFLSFPSLLWGIDRGIVYNLILLSLIFYFLIIRDHKKIIIIFITLFSSWFAFYLLLQDEFYYFIINTYNIITEASYIHGIIHPIPFTSELNSGRVTKTLLSILICLIISIKLFFNSNKKFSNSFKFILLFIALASFLTYINALSRSDGPHIKSTFGYPLIFFTLLILNLFFFYLYGKFKNIFVHKNKIFLLFVILCFLNFDINFNKISKYNERLNNFINLPDQSFLKNKEIELLSKVSPIVNNYECIQLFSNNAAILYLLRSKSCSKYYFIWGLGSKKDQKDLFKYLNNKNLIIYGGGDFNWDMPVSKKLPYLNNFILENYTLLFEVDNYKILEKKN